MAIMGALARNALDFLALGPGFPLRHVSQLLRRRYHATVLRRAGPIVFRPRSSDAETFVDIFRRGAYDFSWLKQYDRVLARYRAILADGRQPVIIDAGANVGAASLWFAQAFPEAVIRAVEPDPDNAEVLRLNAASRPSIEVIQAAIGAEIGAVSLLNPRTRRGRCRRGAMPPGRCR